MKILIISAFPTHPTTAGNLQWILTQAKLLIRLGHEVHYLWAEIKEMRIVQQQDIESTSLFWRNNFHLKKMEWPDRIRSKIKKWKRSYSSDPNLWKCDEIYPKSLTNYVNELNKKYNFDACIVNYFYLTKLFESINIPIKVLSTHDSFAYRNLRVNDNSLYLNANEEAKAIQRSAFVLALQETEKNYFEHLSPKSKVLTVYNYYEYTPSEIVGNKNILFLSSLNPYNINGIRWFINSVFPSILELFPDAKLIIGGAICSLLSDLNTNAHIELQGYINDIDAFYAQGDVTINPVYQGTGLKIKTFESVAFDKVTIVHPHSMEGVFMPSKTPLLVAENAEEWITALKSVWNDSNMIETIKKENKNYIFELDQHIVKQYSYIFSNNCI